MASSNTTPADVLRYVDVDMTDSEVQAFIDDAEEEALAFNDSDDFAPGELDRLVRFYAAYLIAGLDDTQSKSLEQGNRSVTIQKGGSDYLKKRVEVNDPSGELISGGVTWDSDRTVTTT